MSQAPLRLLLIDDDPIFRRGLTSVCEQIPDLRVIAEADSLERVWEILSRVQTSTAEGDALDLIILEFGATDADEGIRFCQRLKSQYRDLPVLLLTTLTDAWILEAVRKTGVEGYCPKGMRIEQLATIIRQVARGESDWSKLLPGKQPSRNPPSRSRFNRFRSALLKPGLLEIQRSLLELDTEKPDPALLERGDWVAVLNGLIINGRRRELRAARWVVKQLLPPSTPEETLDTPATAFREGETTSNNPENALVVRSSASLTPPSSNLDVRSVLFDVLVARLQSKLLNLTGIPLEIDILRLSKKRELIYIVLRQLEAQLDELRFCEIKSEQLEEKYFAVLEEVWKSTTIDFFGKYYTLSFEHREVPLVPVLLEDIPIVEAEILAKIPLAPELFSHLLFQTPLTVDNLSCPVGSPVAMQRAEVLLQNLVIQVANGVMQPLLNHFADSEAIKHKFYDRRLLSTRDIEKFRNNLSWRYRIERLILEPKAIFESAFTLFVFGERGIQKQIIYSPRREELELLSGVPLVVTLVLEGRDAIAPRVRSAVSWIGAGVIYILTNIIGRGLGLVGKGILQGIGMSLQDRKQERE